MFDFEIWPDRVSIHIGDFTPFMFADGHDAGSYITGVVTESESGTFGVALLLHSWGVGISLRFRPGPWTPDEV